MVGIKVLLDEGVKLLKNTLIKLEAS